MHRGANNSGHIHIDADDMCIAQDTTGANRIVVATRDIPPDTLELHVICSHETSMHGDTSNHSLRAKVTVERKTPKDSKVLQFTGDAENLVSEVGNRKAQHGVVDGMSYTFYCLHNLDNRS